MLMQTLAAGRGISFPATCTGVAKFVTRVTGAYAVVRRQFGLNIGRFEGIEEPLARIGGFTYLLEAARVYTCGAVDRGERPAVVAAIAKYQFTELTRKMVTDGMDILGGAGICRGQRNLLSHLYTAMPIPITVEGSNILTRTLMIFGQGAIRCHPFIYPEIEALQNQEVIAFDCLLWRHIGFVIRNGLRSVLLGLSRGRLAWELRSPKTTRYYQKLAWASANFALLTDFAFILWGGSLKRQEKITGRFADCLSWLYLGTASLRRFEAEGSRDADLPYLHWGMIYGFAQIQGAFEGIIAHLPIPHLFRSVLLLGYRLNALGSLPSDRLGHQIAQQVQTPGTDRDRLTAGIHIPIVQNGALGRLEAAMLLCDRAAGIMQKIKTAQRSGTLPKDLPLAIAQALDTQLITQTEAELLDKAEFARQDAIQVDAFTLEDYQRL
jgi:acyl-CoA dehydrogenase